MEYEVKSTDYESVLVVTNRGTGKIFNGHRNRYITIKAVKDFDGDGIDDALISSNGGGNCCPEERSIVTVKNGKLKKVDFKYDWSEIKIVEEGKKVLIWEKTKDETTLYSFNGDKLAVVNKIPKLKALKEVHGSGGPLFESHEPVVLIYDINNDKRPDKIVCPIWERWGSLTCILPVPGKEDQELNIGCDRFGVLKSMSHGFHEFVCDNDTIISFDGNKWIVKGE